MTFLLRRRNAKRQAVSFIPAWSDRVGYGRLEGRALTAPAIFRRPPNDPISESDTLFASATGQQPVVGVNTAHADAILLSGTASADIVCVDLVNPSPPAAPIGTGAVNFSTDDEINISGTLDDAVGTGTVFTREYLLADTTTGTGQIAYVTEDFTANIDVSRTDGVNTATGYSSLGTSGMAVRAGVGFVTVTTDGSDQVVFFESSSGTLTKGSETLTYSITITPQSTFVHVRETHPVGVLPLASNIGSTASGLRFYVHNEDGINTIAGHTPAAGNTKSTYSLEVSNTPPPA